MTARVRMPAAASVELPTSPGIANTPPMQGDWFKSLFGFEERSGEQVRTHLEVDGTLLRSLENGASYRIGVLETPSLGELRARAGRLPVDPVPRGRIRVRNVVGEAGALHADPGNAGALFQVASQFNLLEMVSPGVSPEEGVTRYACDHTQGPACAIAAGAATVYRNYFAMVDGKEGQEADRQIDCLRAMSAARNGNHTPGSSSRPHTRARSWRPSRTPSVTRERRSTSPKWAVAHSGIAAGGSSLRWSAPWTCWRTAGSMCGSSITPLSASVSGTWSADDDSLTDRAPRATRFEDSV